MRCGTRRVTCRQWQIGWTPRGVKLATGGEAWLIEGQPLIPNGQNITGRGPVVTEGGSYFSEDGSPAEGAGDAAQRLREQDIDGIDAEVLFPPIFASRAIENISDKDVYLSLAAAKLNGGTRAARRC